jgi:hypothetical protein
MEWPTLTFGVLFVVGAGFFMLVGPAEYQMTRKLPRWLLPLSRLWPERFDVLVTRAVAGAIAAFGVFLIAGSFFA